MNKNGYKTAFALLTAFCGGVAEAYSYAFRGGVFANMQTGNLMKVALGIIDGEVLWQNLLPMVSFLLGLLIIRVIPKCRKRKLSAKASEEPFSDGFAVYLGLLINVVLIVSAALCPETLAFGILSNCFLSMACAIQFENTSKVGGLPYTSIMCTNNLRLFAENLTDGFFGEKSFGKALFYALVIAAFLFGACVCYVLTKIVGRYAVSVSAVLYFVGIIVYRALVENEDDN